MVLERILRFNVVVSKGCVVVVVLIAIVVYFCV
jgi:hypothetical protein